MFDVVGWLGSLPPVLVYVVAAVLVAAETGLIIGLALPGEFTLIVVGFLSSLHTVNPFIAALVMIVAAMLGDALGFVEGRRIGMLARTVTPLGRWVGDERWARADALLLRHEGRAIFLGRFVAFARTLVPRLCGATGMSYRRFLPWDALGVTSQVGASVLVGYLAGNSYLRAAELLGRATGAFVLLLIVLASLVWFGRYLGAHPDPVTALRDKISRWLPLRRLNAAYDWAFRWVTRRAGVGGAVGATMVLGLLLLLLAGVLLTLAVHLLVSTSGFPLVDPLVDKWIAQQRAEGSLHAAMVTLSVLRGSFCVTAAGVLGVVLNWRAVRWKADLLGVIGTVGAFVPLLILTVASDFVGSALAERSGLFANQITIVTASVGLVAWLVTRRFRQWPVAVTCWTTAVGVVLLVSVSRLYVGGTFPSEVVASWLIGAFWVLIFAVAWRTRDRMRAEEPTPPQPELVRAGEGG